MAQLVRHSLGSFRRLRRAEPTEFIATYKVAEGNLSQSTSYHRSTLVSQQVYNLFQMFLTSGSNFQLSLTVT